MSWVYFSGWLKQHTWRSSWSDDWDNDNNDYGYGWRSGSGWRDYQHGWSGGGGDGNGQGWRQWRDQWDEKSENEEVEVDSPEGTGPDEEEEYARWKRI